MQKQVYCLWAVVVVQTLALLWMWTRHDAAIRQAVQAQYEDQRETANWESEVETALQTLERKLQEKEIYWSAPR